MNLKHFTNYNMFKSCLTEKINNCIEEIMKDQNPDTKNPIPKEDSTGDSSEDSDVDHGLTVISDNKNETLLQIGLEYMPECSGIGFWG